ncbi:MAG: exo-alpha-sialidase [Clostridiales bacterium]|nr:exo-alpha-sialidase [Clostridiales bacterium]
MFFRDIQTSFIAKTSESNPRNSEAAVIRCRDGSLFIVWQCFTKSKFGSGDQAPASLKCKRSYDNGRTWTDERVLVEKSDDCVNLYSPNLIRLRDGSIALLYMKYIHLTSGEPQLSNIYIAKSYDECETFIETRLITENDRFCMSNDCIRRLSSGRIVMPVTYHLGEMWAKTEHIYVTVLISDDDMDTFRIAKGKVDLPMRGAMEPFIAQSENGDLVMVMRSQLGSLFRSCSHDEGETWTKPQTTGLRIPESCPFIFNVPSSRAMVVIWNNSEYDMNWRSHYGKRTPLTIALTFDDGKTFKYLRDIETEPNTAFTNPGAIWLSDDELLVTYWTCPYNNEGALSGPIDLKQAIIKIDRTMLPEGK